MVQGGFAGFLLPSAKAAQHACVSQQPLLPVLKCLELCRPSPCGNEGLVLPSL